MPVLLLHGDNALELSEELSSLRARFNPADVLTFDGPAWQLPALAEASLTAGLFDPERLVIVHDLHERLKGARKDAPEWREVEALLAGVAPTTTLVLVSPDMPGDHGLASIVRETGGDVRSFVMPKRAGLAQWVASRARHRGIPLHRDAAELLVDLIGPNAVMLDTEMEKLATYAGDAPITARTVDLLVGSVTQESIFALVDAIAAGERARAYELLQDQLRTASSTATDFALYLIRMLARQVRILARVRLGQEAGHPAGQIISELKLPRYFADRYMRQARSLPLAQLTSSFERLASLEHELKTGRAEPATGLDLLVADLFR